MATPYWNRVNIRLLTVLLPAIKAPKAPIEGANNGYYVAHITGHPFCHGYGHAGKA